MDKRLILYAIIIIVCIVAVGIGVYAQFFYKDGDTDKLMIGGITGNNENKEQTDENEEAAKSNFDSLFINALTYTSENFNNSAVRKDSTKDLVYTSNQISKTVQGKYSMNINVPTLNIVSKVAEDINTSIEQTFIQKATNILVNAETSTEYTIYNIDYAAYVNGNILSLVIKATLKEGSNPQRIMYLGYNYNLQTSANITLQEYISYKKITTATLQNKINKEIKEISQKTQDLNNVGFSVYTRNPEDSMYKVENTTNYFLGPDNYVYVIYAYGNNNYTSETDIIVF